MAALNWIALALSAIAVIITIRQTIYVRQANHIPLIVDILREFRSLEFQKDYNYIMTKFPQRTTVQALSELEGDERNTATRVAYFFQSIALLVAYRIMDEEMVMATLQTPIKRCWAVLGPYIEADRAKDDRIGMFQFLEHLAVRAEKTSLPRVAAKRRLGLWIKHGLPPFLWTASCAGSPGVRSSARHARH